MPKILLCDGDISSYSEINGDLLSCTGGTGWTTVEYVAPDEMPDFTQWITLEDFSAAFLWGMGLVVASYAMTYPIKIAAKTIKHM